MFVLASLNLRTLYNELGEIENKAFKIGIQLGIPRSKLMKLKLEEDLLAAALDYWLNGNVPDIPITWTSIVRALESNYVNETGCAMRIRATYCHCTSKDSEG